jgi:hypothetical protein
MRVPRRERETVRASPEDRAAHHRRPHRAAGRDATRLQNWERDVEVGIREVNRMMREGLERLTAMGI